MITITMSHLLHGVSDTELKRFAACWLTIDRSTTNWDAASQAYNLEAKTESFKTVTGKAAIKALKNAGVSASNGDGETTGQPKKAAGGKRKKAAAEDEGNDDEEKPKLKKGKGGAKGKKAKSPAAVTEEEEDSREGRRSQVRGGERE
ncbi:hypothetical protein DOTSEDRAFT_71751 [Dothistroma septosporum NZE10]|uniref:Uncharacterized protein n=1 Tax=Dothistroma septosporum (strain NZE10 / CBS 128990) TaxID=675120 RepID=N1PNT6_DOTSN|nr:hypothetical protein DOTSEDRAFT_71751 [Dothistroma septosporum NZE10]